jgi:transcriptional regulator with XRE-family HTH domain
MLAERRNPKSSDSVDLEVGRMIRVQRLARGLTLTELATEIGVTFQQLHKYERGLNRVSMGRLTRIGRALEVDMTYLLGAKKRATTTPAPSPEEQAKFTEAVEMLGRKGALRLVKAFANIPSKPPELRESIVRLVESLGG